MRVSVGGDFQMDGYHGDRDEVVFHFAPTRAHSVVVDVLDGFAGTLISDGCEAYKQCAANSDKVCHAAC